MGQQLSNQTFPYSSHSKVSDVTREKIEDLFQILRANPKVSINKIDGLLSIIPKNEQILFVTDSFGYNLLQKAVSLNHIELVRWILSTFRNVDVNRGACSLPLHIACFKGYKDLAELLLRHRARLDLEFRICIPGMHHHNCEERAKHCLNENELQPFPNLNRSSDKLQNAIYYAIDGDHPEILDLLLQQGGEPWIPFHQKRPLLHVACERGAWKCTEFLVNERNEEINCCYDEYYPIHHAVLHNIKFVEKLLQHGASATVRTSTEQMTILHVLFLISKQSADDALQVTKMLLDHGMREMINCPDSLGNTILHTIIVRYALEESRFNVYQDYTPWTKWDFLHLVRFILAQGARPSINQPGNSVLACVLRHVRDWEFRYELLSMLLQEGGDPNIVGRDGSVPLMVCLVPLINKDLLHGFTHNMKVFYLNCVRILLKHGALVNCSSRTNLTPLHVLVFAASEYLQSLPSEEKKRNFEFISQLLEMLLQWDLNPNIFLGGSRTQHILLSLLELVNLVRNPSDLEYVHELSLILIQYGADVDVDITLPDTICHSQSSFFLKKSSNKVLFYYVQWLCRKEHLLLDPEKRFARIIRLYYNVMGHRDLYTSLKFLHTQSAIVPVRTGLCSVLKELYSRPRSLAQQCRVVIIKNLGRCPAKSINKLNLPSPLIKYLLAFD